MALSYTNYNGSDCTGSDKTLNRTLDVGTAPGIVILERNGLHPEDDYSVSGSTITFLVRIDNRQRITIWQ